MALIISVLFLANQRAFYGVSSHFKATAKDLTPCALHSEDYIKKDGNTLQ